MFYRQLCWFFSASQFGLNDYLIQNKSLVMSLFAFNPDNTMKNIKFMKQGQGGEIEVGRGVSRMLQNGVGYTLL